MVACGSTLANKNMFKVDNNETSELLQLMLYELYDLSISLEYMSEVCNRVCF